MSTQAEADPGYPSIRPVVLDCNAEGARVCLVPEGALLLAGDAVRVSVDVGPDATLQILEAAGTVAYDMRGGTARFDVEVVLAERARLVWHGEPFVAAAGSRTAWTTAARLAAGARLALRETLVLGRHGEQPGRLRHEVRVRRDGAGPVFADGLDAVPGRTAVLLGGHRAIASVLVIGADSGGVAAGPGVRYDLEAGGTLLRALADDAHAATAAMPWEEAVAAMLDGDRMPPAGGRR